MRLMLNCVAACVVLCLLAAPALATDAVERPDEGVDMTRLLDTDVDVATRRALFAQLERAVASDPAPALLYSLGSLYRRGDDAREPAFVKDTDKARELLSRAALGGALLAMAKMSVLELAAGNRFEANVWAQVYYHYRKDALESSRRGSDSFAASLIANAQKRFDRKRLPELNESVGRMIAQYDAQIRAGIARTARELDESGLLPRPSGRGVLPELKGKTPEAGIAEYYVGFDAGGDVDRVWLLDAWPDASLARVLRPIAKGYRVDGAPGVDLSRKFAVLPIEFSDLRHRIRKGD
ncbi:MAG: hypothetical protein J0L88_10055 [Xanthomonadales bacterium]|nr:hypothetical protein [Xanthomonadales bacterium]